MGCFYRLIKRSRVPSRQPQSNGIVPVLPFCAVEESPSPSRVLDSGSFRERSPTVQQECIAAPGTSAKRVGILRRPGRAHFAHDYSAQDDTSPNGNLWLLLLDPSHERRKPPGVRP